ncbi:sigma-54-dependent Fis family transcriptional regulator [Heyndrickxia coagulans]|uniref:Proprionate catabolism activator, Fis family n=1 Tax=Heyndrickxia coagulans 36D1 TaxID=345219 RepID=G2TI04_HEYCO|nr:sigma-54-dependent Fis family transcriptional regulator [Heyndrickxia coagulans]AEP00937.1 proprionate catabolism activator, Fis family [Heyndrickxia coagulans 36D1]APB37352.1 sigma-54-dependent Fis family transcriptional regulator [Heyndrickxia coagulans]KYC91522.1 hypothetical protein B4096_1844 [Heyndrickxia coagulans]QPG53153.1 sigma-54-dependent Fis family transcriptional regulator [Heyndrickxia coagulans]WNE61179.1 sigma-54-dependent Fis family transcriptional regulator [Heyndrickxia 
MKEKKIKALVIVPYEGLYEMMKEVQREVGDFHFDIELGNLFEGVALAKEAENKGYHVIISRGGTASMIQEAVSIPVIDIRVSGYDILRIITLVKGFSRKAAIVGFSNITQGASTVSQLLDLDIETMTITKGTEVNEKLLYLKSRGYEVVIGDVVTFQAAKKLGMTGVLITSGKEAIMEALEEARRSYRIFSKLQQQVSLFQFVLDCNREAIGIFNKEKKIVYANQRFNKEFHWMTVESSEEIKKLIQETVVAGESQMRTVHLNKSLWNITACPQEDTIVLLFELGKAIQTSKEEGNIGRNAIEFHTSISYIPIAGKSAGIQEVQQQVAEYSKSEQPVWICGEKGVGKDTAARLLYTKRRAGTEPFIVINCDTIKAEQLKGLKVEEFFDKYTNGTIYLKNIERLDKSLQREFCQIFKNKNNKLKWLASYEGKIEDKIKKGLFDRDLYQLLGQLKICIPPLRERKEDIEDLVQIFISELHPKHGNQVVGVRPDGLKELIAYDWPGNVKQLKQVIEQLFIQAKSFYIEKDEVVTVLKRLRESEQTDKTLIPIDLSGTLEDIEKRIIKKVLEEEELNQSKAAKRLGINRSTLWRKLK